MNRLLVMALALAMTSCISLPPTTGTNDRRALPDDPRVDPPRPVEVIEVNCKSSGGMIKTCFYAGGNCSGSSAAMTECCGGADNVSSSHCN
jgi:hypothetical protein